MNLKISKIVFFSLVLGLFSNWASLEAQVVVPDLVDVQIAKSRLETEIQKILAEIKSIQKLGGVIGVDLSNKEILFKAVKADLDHNYIGMTTLLAVSSQSNYIGVNTDREALNDFNAGRWDVNMKALIELLKK